MPNKARKNITTIGLGVSFLLGSLGCAYRTIPPDSIQSTKPIERPIDYRIRDKQIEHFSLLEMDKPMDFFETLTWKEAIEYVQTPEEAQGYLNTHMHYDEMGIFETLFGYKSETFKNNHADKEGVCLDYAVAAAALLHDNGYDPLLLGMQGDGYHMVFLYKTEEGLFGALGNTPMPPTYSSVNNLVKAFKLYYGKRFDKYGVLNLDQNFPNKTWINGDIILQRPCLDKAIAVG